MKKYLVLGLAFVLLSAGCSMFDTQTAQMNKSAQQLAAEGAAAYMSENYKDAVKAYTDLRDWYPFSQYAILAELKIADANFHMEEYDQAIVAYSNFEKMHPRNEAVPYVIFQTGMCWFNQLDTIDRDVAPAKNAVIQFNRLLQQYPNNEHAKEASEHIETCVNHMAAHELYVADYYNKTKKYTAALKRYEYIVEFFPGTEQSQDALGKIPEVAELAKIQEKE